MRDYTRAEKKLINDAFDKLSETLSNGSMHLNGDLIAAVKAERTDTRMPMPHPRLKILEAFITGFRRPDMPISELCGIRAGLQQAIILGADCARKPNSIAHNIDAAAIDAAIAAHNTAIA